MRKKRKGLYRKWEKETGSRLLVFVTGDRPGAEAQISPDVIPPLTRQLEKIGDSPDLSVFLYTCGGNTSTAWTIIHLLKTCAKKLRILVPYKAQSAGTILCLGADEIWMTRQAILGPIDPIINTALNPPLPDGRGTFPVSVEQVHGFLDFAREELRIRDEKALADLYMGLAEYVHPLVLGQAYHSKSQIFRMAEQLLSSRIKNPDLLQHTLSFLCGDAGSHDYAISRREAEELGLPIVRPNDWENAVIGAIYEDIRKEMLMDCPFGQEEYGGGAYLTKKCLLESLAGGTDEYITEGDSCLSFDTDTSASLIRNTILFEGWRHRSWK